MYLSCFIHLASKKISNFYSYFLKLFSGL